MTIAGPLAVDIDTIVVPPAALPVDAVGCAGAMAASALVGLTGARLLGIIREAGEDLARLLPLLDEDPQAAVAIVSTAPLTCGAMAVGGEEQLWAFGVTAAAVPVLLVSAEDPAAACALADSTATVPLPPPPSMGGGVATLLGGGGSSLAAAAARARARRGGRRQSAPPAAGVSSGVRHACPQRGRWGRGEAARWATR